MAFGVLASPRVALLVCVAACAPAPPPDASAPKAEGPCWPVAAMELVAANGTPLAEMQGDGSIYGLKGGERHFFGRVSNDALLDARETPVFACVHREVGLPGSPSRGRYDDRDAFVGERGVIAIDDEGWVTIGGNPAGARVLGPIARARRTAALLVLAASFQ